MKKILTKSNVDTGIRENLLEKKNYVAPTIDVVDVQLEEGVCVVGSKSGTEEGYNDKTGSGTIDLGGGGGNRSRSRSFEPNDTTNYWGF